MLTDELFELIDELFELIDKHFVLTDQFVEAKCLFMNEKRLSDGEKRLSDGEKWMSDDEKLMSDEEKCLYYPTTSHSLSTRQYNFYDQSGSMCMRVMANDMCNEANPNNVEYFDYSPFGEVLTKVKKLKQ